MNGEKDILDNIFPVGSELSDTELRTIVNTTSYSMHHYIPPKEPNWSLIDDSNKRRRAAEAATAAQETTEDDLA